MNRTKALWKPLALTGALALGNLGRRAFFNTLPGADAKFFHWTGSTGEFTDKHHGRIVLPIRYYRADVFLGVFSAALKPVKAALPSPDLHPVRLGENRTQIVIAAYNYLQTDAGPYGEVLIGALCTLGHEAPPVLPLLLESRYPSAAYFVFHLPVTTVPTRDGGRNQWGYPKFIGDMNFDLRPHCRSVRLREGAEHILTLTIKQRGMLVRDNRPLRTYTVYNGDILRTTIPARTIYQTSLAPNSGSLVLGEHAIAVQLREFEVSPTPFMTRSMLSFAAILPEGVTVAPAARPYPGHQGRDVFAGHHTIRYDDFRTPVTVSPVEASASEP